MVLEVPEVVDQVVTKVLLQMVEMEQPLLAVAVAVLVVLLAMVRNTAAMVAPVWSY